MPPGLDGDADTDGRPASPWKLPSYSDLRPVRVSPAELEALGVGSVLELVEKVNEFRAGLGMRYVSKSKFPTSMRNWKALTAEFRIARPDGPDPLLEAPRVKARKASVRPANGSKRLPTYSLDIPVIDFIAEHLDILPWDQAYAMDLALGISGRCQNFDAIAEGLSCSKVAAKGAFDKAFNTFESKSRCWSIAYELLMHTLKEGPVLLDDVTSHPWSYGIPLEALDMLLGKVANVHPIEIPGHGWVAVLGDRKGSIKAGRMCGKVLSRDNEIGKDKMLALFLECMGMT